MVPEDHRLYAAGICFFPLFIAAVRWHDWGPFRLLNVGSVKFAGVMSYSIYLLHPAVLRGVTKWAHVVPAVIQAALAMGLTLALAFVIYVAVEKPASRLRRRLSRVLAPVAPARPAATARVSVAPLAVPAVPVER